MNFTYKNVFNSVFAVLLQTFLKKSFFFFRTLQQRLDQISELQARLDGLQQVIIS